MVITAGHHSAFDYEYSFFKTAVRCLERQFKTQALAVTCGVGAILDKKAMSELQQ